MNLSWDCASKFMYYYALTIRPRLINSPLRLEPPRRAVVLAFENCIPSWTPKISVFFSSIFQFLLHQWGEDLNSRTGAEKMGTRGKFAHATYSQTQQYLKPLLRKLKNKTLPEDISDSLTEITKHILDRNYIAVSLFFFLLLDSRYLLVSWSKILKFTSISKVSF